MPAAKALRWFAPPCRTLWDGG